MLVPDAVLALVLESFVAADRASAPKVNVVAHAMSVVDGHVGVDRVAFGIPFQTAGGNKSVAGQDDIGYAEVNRLGIDLTAGEHSDAVIHFNPFQFRRRIRRVQGAVTPAALALAGKIFMQDGKMR